MSQGNCKDHAVMWSVYDLKAMWCNTIIHHCIIIVDWLIKHRENMNKTHNLYSNCHENQILVFDMRVQKVITENQPSQLSRIQNVGTEWNPGHDDRSLWHFHHALHYPSVLMNNFSLKVNFKLFFSFPGLLQV